MTLHRLLTTSPQRADPLTWILSFNLPFAGAISAVVGGTIIAVTVAWQGVSPLLIIIAAALSSMGCLLIMRSARVQRPVVRSIETVLPISLGIVSMIVSAIGHRGSQVPLTEWTGPLGLGTVMLALVPYSSALLIAGWGIVGAVVAGALARWAFTAPDVGEWSLLIGGSSIPLHVGVAGAVFSGMVVSGVARWRALPYDREESSDRPVAFSRRLREHGAPISIGDDVLALLGRIADGGRVTAKERADAAALATGIRTDLVSVMNRSWLETIPQHARLTVHDPHNAANRMTRAQRAAVHTLITAALESPVLAGEGLRIELRSLDNGTTAVALSMNITLPEGRRVMMLAPYFISLKASVDDFEWAVGEQLSMRFKLPPPASGERRS